ncbi:MAG TPA: protein-glutamate O-methyltransferase CheR [Vicinamibacterales bacterium]|nr:protein-glutamate O-methyltransferase CheR [Vicinamibacterales bacterium]
MKGSDPIHDAGDLRLSDGELARIVRLVYERSGITLHAGKRALVLARLQKRLRAGGFSRFRDYIAHVEHDASGGEITALLDAIATNHTSFFREPQHFEYLRSTVVPVLAQGNIRIWSAACSSGEEPVTLAITLLDALEAQHHGRIRILASDLSTRALAAASCGVYKMERVAGIPLDVLRRHFERGLGAQTGQARVAAHVRRSIEYRQLNFLEASDLGERFEVIFCRNVMIYFDRDVQQRVVSLLERHLAPGGYLFISHSESLNGTTHGLRWVAPAIYQRPIA